MFLSEIFLPDFIKVGLDSVDKDEVFEELVDYFCHSAKSNAREEFLAALREREEKMSTGIQQGIAVPHGKTNAVDRVCGVLGISKRGIDYDALDGKPVYLLFMVLTPELDREKHLRLLQRLAELLDNPQFYTELLAQHDAQGAYGVIKKYEDILLALN
jgi:PTS system fructose-specific IIC component/PTS system nitrogen regulatory IIA component